MASINKHALRLVYGDNVIGWREELAIQLLVKGVPMTLSAMREVVPGAPEYTLREYMRDLADRSPVCDAQERLFLANLLLSSEPGQKEVYATLGVAYAYTARYMGKTLVHDGTSFKLMSLAEVMYRLRRSAARSYKARRIRLNRGGYDRRGQYWGHLPGTHLYAVDQPDGNVEHVRARTAVMAKYEAAKKATPVL